MRLPASRTQLLATGILKVFTKGLEVQSPLLPSSSSLITGFGPFGSFADNPSSILARESGMPHEIIEVSFAAVDEFVESLKESDVQAVMFIGVAGGATKMRLETIAHNKIGSTPDVRGVIGGPSQIDPKQPAQLAGTLWTEPALQQETETRMISLDAGGYLCNYIYFRALQHLPEKRLGFLHVPPVENMPLDTQKEELKFLIETCF